MIFQNWIDNVSLIFGTTSTQTAMLVSFLITICTSILVLIAMGKDQRKLESLIAIDFLIVLILMYAGWMPIFLGSVIALIFAGIGAMIVRDWISGR